MVSNNLQPTNPTFCDKNNLSEPSRGERGRFKSQLDISSINPYELLRLLMQIRGYSYRELGNKFGGYRKSYICEIFHGDKMPNEELQQRIANLFSLPIKYLWGN